MEFSFEDKMISSITNDHVLTATSNVSLGKSKIAALAYSDINLASYLTRLTVNNDVVESFKTILLKDSELCSIMKNCLSDLLSAKDPDQRLVSQEFFLLLAKKINYPNTNLQNYKFKNQIIGEELLDSFLSKLKPETRIKISREILNNSDKSHASEALDKTAGKIMLLLIRALGIKNEEALNLPIKVKNEGDLNSPIKVKSEEDLNSPIITVTDEEYANLVKQIGLYPKESILHLKILFNQALASSTDTTIDKTIHDWKILAGIDLVLKQKQKLNVDNVYDSLLKSYDKNQRKDFPTKDSVSQQINLIIQMVKDNKLRIISPNKKNSYIETHFSNSLTNYSNYLQKKFKFNYSETNLPKSKKLEEEDKFAFAILTDENHKNAICKFAKEISTYLKKNYLTLEAKEQFFANIEANNQNKIKDKNYPVLKLRPTNFDELCEVLEKSTDTVALLSLIWPLFPKSNSQAIKEMAAVDSIYNILSLGKVFNDDESLKALGANDRFGNSKTVSANIFSDTYFHPYYRDIDYRTMKTIYKNGPRPQMEKYKNKEMPFISGPSGMANMLCKTLAILKIPPFSEKGKLICESMAAFIVGSGMHSYYEVYKSFNIWTQYLDYVDSYNFIPEDTSTFFPNEEAKRLGENWTQV